MARPRSVYRCAECGHDHSKWAGRCEACGEWNTIAEEPLEVRAAPAPGKGPRAAHRTVVPVPQPLADVE